MRRQIDAPSIHPSTHTITLIRYLLGWVGQTNAWVRQSELDYYITSEVVVIYIPDAPSYPASLPREHEMRTWNTIHFLIIVPKIHHPSIHKQNQSKTTPERKQNMRALIDTPCRLYSLCAGGCYEIFVASKLLQVVTKRFIRPVPGQIECEKKGIACFIYGNTNWRYLPCSELRF